MSLVHDRKYEKRLERDFQIKTTLAAIDILLNPDETVVKRAVEIHKRMVASFLYSLVDASRATKLRTFCCSTTNRGGMLR